MRVAVLGADHWHWPLYEAALLQSGADIVAISATTDGVRQRLSSLFNCPSFADDAEVVERTQFDFGFVFGTHRSMGATACLLADRGIAFSVEKPVAFDAAGRQDLLKRVKARPGFVSIPLVYRVTPLPELLDRFVCDHGDLAHLSVRCFAGPPSRYLENGSPWMVDPELSGGGSTKNLAPHYVDLFLARVRQRAVSVSAAMNSLTYGFEVEDYSSLRIRTEEGAIAMIETGYNFPVQYGIRDFSLVASTRSAFIRSSETSAEILDRAGKSIERKEWNIDSNAAFLPYVHDVLRRFREGKPPVIGLEEFNPVMDVIDAGYQSQRSGGSVTL